jgi:gluconolactonase
VAVGAKLERLCDGFAFTEGPAADAEGNVFFTDQPNDRILKWSVDGKLSVFLSPCGRSNGTFFDREGNLWTCADMNNELWKIDPHGKVTVIVKDYKGKKLNGPNDLWIARNGGIYFTDPFYQREYWTRGPMEQDGQHVYYLTPDRKDLIRVINDLVQPNGIIGTPGGEYLYVADIGAGKTYRYRVNPDGSLSDKKLFCSMGSDGMTVDSEGNLYLTGDGVTVFNPHGQEIEHILVPAGWTANVTFGGEDRKTLFVTAEVALYGLRMRVKEASIMPDFNRDNKVDIQDLLELIRSWGQNDPSVDIAPPPFGDGVVDEKDLEVLMTYWGQDVYDPTLLAHWKLDETEGMIAHDAAGGNDAAVVGNPLWQPEGGQIGGALAFDGKDDQVSSPLVVNPAEGAFSVFAWVKGGAPGQVVLSQPKEADWLMEAPDGGFKTGLMGTGRRGKTLASPAVITDDAWHRLGLVWDGTNRILYVDDTEVARDTPGGLASSTGDLIIGSGSTLAPGTFWSGLIDDVRIYDRAVTP